MFHIMRATARLLASDLSSIMTISTQTPRKGAAAVELAVCLPILLILFVIVVDLARAFRTCQALSQCARVAAAYESDADLLDVSAYESAEKAGLAAGSHLGTGLTISVREETDGAGNPVVQATASCPFRLLLGIEGRLTKFDLERTAYARFYPSEER